MTPNDFYNLCNLKQNPFVENPAVASHSRASIWVGYEPENKKLVRVLKQARSDQLGSTRFFLLYGGFGTGKSHALLWAQNLILHKEKEQFNSCAYFIRSLKTHGGKFSFYRAFQEYVVNQSELLKDLDGFKYFLSDKVAFYKKEHNIEPETDPNVVLKQIFQSPELVNLASKILHSRSEQEIQNSISVSDDFDSIICFTNIVKLFTYNIPSTQTDDNRFKRAVYLFIDEMDDLQLASAKEARIVNDHLRHLYDSCQGCFALGVALSAEVAELPMYFTDFVLSRIDRSIELSLLDKPQALDFIRQMISEHRVKEDDSFYPFGEDAIEYIVDQINQMTPRKLVKAMYETIEQVRLEEFEPSKENLITLDRLDDMDIMEEIVECL